MESEWILDGQKTDARMQGNYATPEVLARFLVNWAIHNPSDTVIEPCCGNGVFLEAVAYRLLHLGGNKADINRVVGVEIEPTIAKQAHERLFNRFQVCPKIIPRGFFETFPSLPKESFDAVIGNPPFVGYKYFFKDERELALRFLNEQGFNASKLTNAWVPFLVASMYLLKEKGRLAMIMPAGLFHVSYASEVREYLLDSFGFVVVYAFNNLVFPNVEQEIILLMGTKGEKRGLRLIEVKDEIELNEPFNHTQLNPQIPVEDSKEKWTQYFLTNIQREILRKALANDSIHRLGEVCSVDVGVVTGKNDFFVLPEEAALELGAKNHLLPIVTRTRHLPGLVFTENDWLENKHNNRPSYLLAIKPAIGFSENLEHYINRGERDGCHGKFKCKNRSPWYVVPSTWVPDAFLFRQIGSFPRLILNSTKATCTDTLHRVKFKKRELKKYIVTCFHNSLTLAFAEILGRSYGGGVLELMPTEAEKLPIPIPKSEPSNLLAEMDDLVREGVPNRAVDLCDEKILIKELGFRKEDILVIRDAWKNLSGRRSRKKR